VNLGEAVLATAKVPQAEQVHRRPGLLGSAGDQITG